MITFRETSTKDLKQIDYISSINVVHIQQTVCVHHVIKTMD